MSASPEDRLVNLLGVLSLTLRDELVQAAEAASGFSDAAPAALSSLHETGSGQSIEHLSRLVGLTHSGAVRLVDRLAQAGLVERRTGRDGRTVGLGLTPAGVEVALRIRSARYDVVRAALEPAMAPLSPSERADLAPLLADAVSAMVAGLARRRLEARAAGNQPTGGAMCRLCDFTACGRPDGRCPASQAAQTYD